MSSPDRKRILGHAVWGGMDMTEKEYGQLVKELMPKSPIRKNCCNAFAVGGLICVIGQFFMNRYSDMGLDQEMAGTAVSMTLVALSALLTGLSVYDNIAKYAGAGTLVPITGFANAVVSPAIDSHAEGLILGVGAKIFTVAGPVLLYGTLAGAVFGVIYFIAGLL